MASIGRTPARRGRAEIYVSGRSADRGQGEASYGASRPDVGAIFGTRYTPSGFDVTGPLPPGNYDIVAFAHSSTTNSFSAVRVVRVTVQLQNSARPRSGTCVQVA